MILHANLLHVILVPQIESVKIVCCVKLNWYIHISLKVLAKSITVKDITVFLNKNN